MDNKLIFDIEADELEIFLDEVNEHMQVMESGILRLEKGANSDLVNSVFRGAHTIKALAGTVGHHKMADLTHTMENLFDEMRNDQMVPTQTIIDDLLTAVDVLKVLRDEIVSQEASGIDIGPILGRLRTLVEQDSAGMPAEPAAGETAGNSIDISKYPLSDEQLATVKKAQDAGQSIYQVELFTGSDTFAPAARLLQAVMALESTADLLVQLPSSTDLANSKHEGKVWALVAAAKDTAAEIEKTLAEVSDLASYQVVSLDTFEKKAKPKTPPKPVVKVPTVTPKTDLGADKTVRISVERLDDLMNLVGELVTNRNRLQRVEDELRLLFGKEEIVGELNETSMHMGRVIDQLQEEVMRARMLPISNLFDKFPRIVRDVSRSVKKKVDLVIEGGNTELDRSLIEAIGDPLIHLLRNAVDHGIEPPEERIALGKPETGTVNLTAAHIEGQIVISIIDDGRGIDPAKLKKAAVKRGLISEDHAAQLNNSEAVDLIFMPNMSTAEKVTDVSGRGVGMDVVRTNVERLSGAVLVESELGKGTIFRVTLPLTLAIVETMLVQLWDAVYAIPLTSINDVLYLSEVNVSTIAKHPAIRWRGSVLSLIDLREFFADLRIPQTSLNGHKQAIVSVTWGKQRSGLIVDKIIGKQGIVVKSLSPIMGEIPGISGGTILGDGRIALILDVPSLMNAALKARRGG